MNKSGKTGFQEKTGFLCLFSTFGLQFSTDFYKVWFSGVLRSPWVTWGMKIRIPGKNQTPKFSGFLQKWFLCVILRWYCFFLFLKYLFSKPQWRFHCLVFVILRHQRKWLNTPRFGIKWLVFTKSPRIQNLPEAGSRAECARSAHERECI